MLIHWKIVFVRVCTYVVYRHMCTETTLIIFFVSFMYKFVPKCTHRNSICIVWGWIVSHICHARAKWPSHKKISSIAITPSSIRIKAFLSFTHHIEYIRMLDTCTPKWITLVHVRILVQGKFSLIIMWKTASAC